MRSCLAIILATSVLIYSVNFGFATDVQEDSAIWRTDQEKTELFVQQSGSALSDMTNSTSIYLNSTSPNGVSNGSLVNLNSSLPAIAVNSTFMSLNSTSPARGLNGTSLSQKNTTQSDAPVDNANSLIYEKTNSSVVSDIAYNSSEKLDPNLVKEEILEEPPLVQDNIVADGATEKVDKKNGEFNGTSTINNNATVQNPSPSQNKTIQETVMVPSSTMKIQQKIKTLPTLSKEQENADTIITKLPNGLTVVIKKDNRFPLVALRLYVHAGSAYETPSRAGISHVLEHMVFKGTKNKPNEGAIAHEIESAGGYLNAATSFDYTVYLTDMLRGNWEGGLEALKEMAFNPLLATESLDSEKDVIVAELKRGEDSPQGRLFKMMQEKTFAGTPYQHPIIGYEKTIRSFSSKDISDYIDEFYQPQSMMLLICGDVSVKDALEKAANTFGSLENKQAVVKSQEYLTPSIDNFSTQIEKGPWQKVHLSLAFPAPNMNDLRSAQLDVLAQLLGGDSTSRFYRTYKYEKRLVDSIYVGNYGLEKTGLIYIQVTLDPDKLVAFWSTFLKDFSKISSVIFTNEELARAKLNIEDDLFRSKETLSGLASKTGLFYFLSQGELSEENYLTTVKEIEQKTIQSISKEVFNPQKATLVGLLPESASVEKYKLPAKFSSVEEWMGKTFNDSFKIATKAQSKEEDESADQKREVIELGKGRTVILQPDKTLPYVATTLLFTGGESLLKKEEEGLGAFTASLVAKGNTKYNAKGIENYQSDRASSLSTSSNRHTFSISINGPSQFLSEMLYLQKLTISNPTFKKIESDRVKENQIAAITSTEDSPIGLAFRRMFPFLFPEHSYGYLQLGEKESVQKFTPEKAMRFWKKQIGQPWVLSVCGTFTKEEILAAAKNLPIPFIEKKNAVNSSNSTIPMPEWTKEKSLNLNLPNRNQAHLMLVFPAAPIGSEDEAALDLLREILAGQSGLLFRDLRDKQGLGYTVTAFPWKSQQAGSFIFYIGTEPEKMEQAEKGFYSVIASLQENELPEEALNRGKQQLAGDYYRERQTFSSRSGEVASMFIFGKPLDLAQKTIEKAQKLNPGDIKAVAQKYLSLEKAHVIKVLP